MKFLVMVCAALVALTTEGAEAKCRLTMPSADWVKASAEFGGTSMQCNKPKCGGSGYVVSFGENRVKAEIAERAIKGRSLPLRFLGMKGAAATSASYQMEGYYGKDRIIVLGAYGKSASIRIANMALLKKSLRCD